MRHRKWSALLGSLMAAVLPVYSPPPPTNVPPEAEMSWTTLLSQAPPPAGTPPGGSRGSGDLIIPVAPGGPSVETWSNRPLFLWQGIARQLELVSEMGDLIWQQQLQENTRSCWYTGKPLVSGNYEWILYSPAKVAVTRVLFQVMPAEAQAKIAADLAALNIQKITSEQMALQRAYYFAQRQLWPDVWREAFSVVDPSAELAQLLDVALR